MWLPFASSNALNLVVCLDFSVTATTSPTLSEYDGMLTLEPFTVKCAWFTSCLASRLVLAKPNLYTALSSLNSNCSSKTSPVMPLVFSAFRSIF